jgi:hypothetical protein
MAALFGLWALVAVAARAGAAEETASPWLILANPDYWNSDDTRAVAARMRADARARGISLDAVEGRANPMSDSDKAANRLVLPLSIHSVTVDVNTHTLVDAVHADVRDGRSDRRYVAMLAARRALTIAEVADLLDGGVRVLEMSAPYQLTIRATAAQIAAIADKEYFLWAGEYDFSMKQSPWFKASKSGRYIVYYFGTMDDARMADIRSIGASAAGFNDKSRTMGLTATWDQVQLVGSLWWVREIIKEPEGEPEWGLLAPHPSGSGDKAVYVDSRAQYSREIVGGSSGTADGGGVTIGIVDLGFNLAHESVNGKWRAQSPSGNPLGRRHGTAMASLVAGRDLGNGACWEHPDDRFTGLAPGASLVSGIAPESAWATEGFDQMLTRFKGNQVRVVSWGYRLIADADEPRFYDKDAKWFDGQAYSNDLLIIAPVGNTTLVDHVPSPAQAKNVLAVGAIDFAEDFLHGAGRISAYSVTGGTEAEYRLKPELVAPGGKDGVSDIEKILAAESDVAQAGWYYCDNYSGFVGTSCAGALTAGAAGRVLSGLGGTATSQLLKALLINTAIPLKGNESLGYLDERKMRRSGYANTTYGYGLVNPYSCVYYDNQGGNYASDKSIVRFVFPRPDDTESIPFLVESLRGSRC